MSTLTVVLIVLAAIVLALVIAAMVRRARVERQIEHRRVSGELAAHREAAEVSDAKARELSAAAEAFFERAEKHATQAAERERQLD